MPSVIDLFAGAGGFGLGFHLAGYHLFFSLEIDRWAADTLRENNLGTVILEDDITKYQSEHDIHEICDEAPDVIIGGPPCQGFSIAGPAEKDPGDPRNCLFKDFARWVKCLEPKVFVMENVRGILSRRNANQEKVIEIITKTFSDLGYTIEVWELNAAEYGVPQVRERVFVTGNRSGIIIGAPPTTHYLSRQNPRSLRLESYEQKNKFHAIGVWKAISDLPKLKAKEGSEEQPYSVGPKTDYQSWARGNQDTLYNHVAMRHTKRIVERFRKIHWRRSVLHAPTEHRAQKRNGNGEAPGAIYDSNNRRLHPFMPSYTIPAHFYSSFIHPYQHRNLTAREAARLQSFPDWYRFMGKRTVVSRKLLERSERNDENCLSQYNQVGNAVPPLLSKAIAEHIFLALDGLLK